MEDFDPESFVNRLVADDPSPGCTDRSGRWKDSGAPIPKIENKHLTSIAWAWDEYDDDRHAFLRQQEVCRHVGPGYLAGRGRLGFITPGQRTAIVNWIVKLHAAVSAPSGGGHPLSLEALFLSVNLVDRFLSTSEGGRVACSVDWSIMEIAGVACLGLALKYEDSQSPSLSELANAITSLEYGPFGDINYCCARVGEKGLNALRDEMVAMEQRVLSALDNRLTVPTALSFLEMFMRRASLLGYLPEGPAADRVREEAQQILLRVLRDSSSLSHMPSTLTAAALNWASRIATPEAFAASPYAFVEVTGYEIESVRHCLSDMEAVFKGSGTDYMETYKCGTSWTGTETEGLTREGFSKELPPLALSARRSTPPIMNYDKLSSGSDMDPDDSEMDSFDAEDFVNRLVADDPSPGCTDRSGRWKDSGAPIPKIENKHLTSIAWAWDEYDDDRHAFLRQQEVCRHVGPGYLAGRGRLGFITPGQRTAIVNWIVKLHAAVSAPSGGGHPLSLEALFLSVNLVDRFLSTSEGGRVACSVDWSIMEIAGVACLGLALKYEDSQSPSLSELANAITSLEYGPFGDINHCRARVGEKGLNALRDEMVAMEQRVLSALDNRLTVPTALSFLEMFMRRASLLGYLPEGPAADRVREEAQQILLRVLRDSCSLSHMPSTLAAAALNWASRIATPEAFAASSYAFVEVTGYEIESVRHCLSDMEAVFKGSGTDYMETYKCGTSWTGTETEGLTREGFSKELPPLALSARRSTPPIMNYDKLSSGSDMDPDDSEMDSFDAEDFVNRLVANEPSPRRTDGSDVASGGPFDTRTEKRKMHPTTPNASPTSIDSELSFGVDADFDVWETKHFAESYVSRLVEDDPAPGLANGPTVTHVGSTESKMKETNKASSNASIIASVFIQLLFFHDPAGSKGSCVDCCPYYKLPRRHEAALTRGRVQFCWHGFPGMHRDAAVRRGNWPPGHCGALNQ